jgi:peroxiredoxin-like protein
MAEEKHIFSVKSVWAGDSDGDGVLETDAGCVAYGRPSQLGGAPSRANPEQLLVEALASCYSITLAVIAEGKRLPITKIEVAAEGDIVRQPDRTLKFTAIRLKPVLTVDSTDESVKQKALAAAHHAEKYCLISKALDCSVEITLEPSIANGS